MVELLKQPLIAPLSAGLAAVALAGFALTGTAQAQPIETSSAIWCDKAEQLEDVLRAHASEGVSLPAAMERVNAKAQDPGACIMATAFVNQTSEIRRVVIGNEMISIREYLVIGVMKSGQPVQIEPQVWFAARVLAQLTAL